MARILDRSKALMARAEILIPGGVNSPVRAFRSVGGAPPFIKEAKGAWMTDEDDNRYIDYVGSWGPAIMGHAHPEVVAAVCEAAQKGTSFGAPTAAEVEMAQLVGRLFPSMQVTRMVSSGTEATMSALRLARGATGRDAIVKFEGCYHGHADSLLVKAGSGAASFGVPDSAGIPADVAKHTWTLPYNDAEALTALFEARGDEIAAVIVEPVAGNMGVIPPNQAFLDALQSAPLAHGALLIFDEVMSGFRVAPGGAQELFDVVPDLTCLGKVVGGGLPVGMYGGRADIMAHISPVGDVYQAGTLSGNPLATAAGLATMRLLEEPGVFAGIAAATERLAEGLLSRAIAAGLPAVVQRVGAMFTLFFSEGPVTDFASAQACDHEMFGAYHRGMLERGVHLPPSGYEACFVSAAHGDDEIERTLAAASEVFEEIAG